MPKKLEHIDLFAGPGGICTGFMAAGLKTVAAVEYVESCCETYSANHPEVAVFCEDVRKVTGNQILKKVARAKGSIAVVSAGFPCETFSTAGSKSRVYNDHRNHLYQEAIRIANEVDSQLLVLENVPAFLSKRISKESKKKVYDCLVDDLQAAGFKYHNYWIVNAANLGIPQSRTRFIMVASKKISIPKDLLEISELKSTTILQAISDLPLIGPNTESTKYASSPRSEFQKTLRSREFWGIKGGDEVALTYHISPKHRPGTIERFKLIKPGESLKSLFDRLSPARVASLQAKRVLPKKWFIQRNYRLLKDGISRTVTSHCLDELVHPTLDRCLSIREAARLQSFPDWYDFKGGPIICPHISKTQDKYEQIGDAVPPLLAKFIGSRIIGLLSQKNHANNASRGQRKVLAAV